MIYKFLTGTTLAKIDTDGISRESCATTDKNYLEWLAAGNTPVPADVPTLAQVKAEQIHLVNQAADAAFDAITSPYPKQEVATWPNQYAEAWALQSDPAAYCPTLTAIAQQAGVTVPVLAASVLQKAAAYTQASGTIVGKRKKLTDQINSETTDTIDKVKGITW